MAFGFLFLLCAVSGAVIAAVGYRGAAGRLPRNHFAGIRTGFTLESEENWLAVHRAAGPIFLYGGVLVAATALAVAPFALAGKFPTLVSLIVLVAVAVIALSTIGIAWYAGTAYAIGASTRE